MKREDGETVLDFFPLGEDKEHMTELGGPKNKTELPEVFTRTAEVD